MAALAFHEVVHEGRLSEFSLLDKPSFPCQRCKLHHGRLVDTYCADHDVVCCTTCVSIGHRECKGIDYLPNVAKGVKKSSEYLDLIGSMKVCFQTFDETQISLENDRTAVQEMNKNGVRGVETYIEKLKINLSNLERNSSHQIQAECKKKEEEINSALDNVQGLKAALTNDWDRIQDTNNECQIFVYAKTGKTTLKETETQLAQLDKPAKMPLFLLNPAIESMLFSEQSLGRFGKTVVLHGEYAVKCEDDEKRCDITGSCYHHENGLILADWANKKLKVLSDSYNVAKTCSLESAPWAVCFTGQDEVAVTFPLAKKVQFVTVGKSFVIGKEFKVAKVCRGMCMKDEKLFIACEGGVREGAGHLQVYSLLGKHLQTVKGRDVVQLPLHLSASPYSSQIYVADAKLGIVSFHISHMVGDVICRGIVHGSRAICATEQKGLFATDATSNNILQVSPELNICTEPVSNQDNQKGIQSLAFDTVHSRLIATVEKFDTIRVFDFHT